MCIDQGPNIKGKQAGLSFENPWYRLYNTMLEISHVLDIFDMNDRSDGF